MDTKKKLVKNRVLISIEIDRNRLNKALITFKKYNTIKGFGRVILEKCGLIRNNKLTSKGEKYYKQLTL